MNTTWRSGSAALALVLTILAGRSGAGPPTLARYPRFLRPLAFSAIRALTSFRTRAADSGLSG